MMTLDQRAALSNVRFAGESLRAVILNDAPYLEGDKRQPEIESRAAELQNRVRRAAKTGISPVKILRAISENALHPPEE